MALWEYKIIGSGKGGFGSPSLLETHLNQLGKDEWEIIAFNSHPENPLAFHGLARRTTQRDWTLQDAAAAAAKAEAEKLRAEFAAKFQAAQALTAAAEDKPSTLVAETASPEDGLRSLRDTDHDQDPEALADADDDDWKQLESEDELPTFFEFIRPHMRRNQRGPGMSLAVDYLANKIEQSPGEVVGALRECGFEIPEREDDDPVYLEYDGDLYWINTNRHHQLFINTKEKPRPVFRTSKGQPFAPPEKLEERPSRQDPRQRRPEPAVASAPAASVAAVPTAPASTEGAAAQEASATVEPGSESSAGGAAAPASAAIAPTESQAPKGGPASPNLSAEASPGAVALMGRLRPMMRRNRRGPGVSGSVSFLSRALKQSDQELSATLAAAGFVVPAQSNDKPVFTDVGVWTYWLNKDSRGGLWINGRERRDRDGRDRQDRSGGRSEGAAREDEIPGPTEAAEGVSPETGAAVISPEGTVLPAADVAVNPVAVPVVEPAPVATPVIAEPVVTPLAEPVVPLAVAPAEETPSEPVPAFDAVADEGDDAVAPTPSADESLLASVRPLLKVKPRGAGASADLTSLAQALGRSDEVLLRELGAAGLVLPAEGEEKSPTVTLGNEQLWLQKSEKDGMLWVNAKAKPVRKPRAPGAPRRAPRKAAGTEPAGGAADGA